MAAKVDLDNFFNQGPMRYPTMSGLGIDAAGLAGAQPQPSAAAEEVKKAPEEPQPASILK